MTKGKTRKTYSGEFMQMVVEAMRTERLSHREAARRFGLTGKDMIANWERIYLEQGPEGLYHDRRGRAGGARRGRKPNLDKNVEEDLIAENQRLRAEIDYLKNRTPWFWKRNF